MMIYVLNIEIFNILKPGGIFINIEHVASESAGLHPVFETFMVDHRYACNSKKGIQRSREDIARDFRERHDRDANVVTSVTTQCAWLREIGYTDVDCYFKVFELAIFGGCKHV